MSKREIAIRILLILILITLGILYIIVNDLPDIMDVIVGAVIGIGLVFIVAVE